MTAHEPGPFAHDDPHHAAELAARDGFQIEAEAGDDERTVVRPIGELDMLTAPALHERIGDVLAEGRTVVVDLGGLTFVDSAGLRILLLAHGTGVVVLRDPSPAALQTFDLAKVTSLLLGDSSGR
jgi:anti-anti-sigma factor